MGQIKVPNWTKLEYRNHDDTIRNFFRRFTQASIYEFYHPLWRWLIERLPQRPEGYTLDLDSTVFERYGKQQGAVKGYNPKKPGRPSHHPLVAILAEAHFVVHGWLRSGNCSSSRGVVEFLKEALALLASVHRIRVVRADSGFFDDKLLSFLEEQNLPCIVVARLTRWIKSKAIHIQQWKDLDATYSVAEFHKQLHGWTRERRIVVVRELLREKLSLGRRLLSVPGYTFDNCRGLLFPVGHLIWMDWASGSNIVEYSLPLDGFNVALRAPS